MAIPYIIFIVFALISFLIQWQLKSKFKKGSEYPTERGLSGKDVAELMLKQEGIYDVKVIRSQGFLSDHYNPINKTVALSPEVYDGKHVMAAAVAAHECGHAVQHATAYQWLNLRSSLVPIVSFTSSWLQWILLGGILLLQTFPYLLLFGIILFGLTTLFSFITLPVEIDASRRAVVWLEGANVTSTTTQPLAISVLKTAAYTYVVGALASLAQLVYYIMIYMRRN